MYVESPPTSLLILATRPLPARSVSLLAAKYPGQPAVIVDLRSAIDPAAIPKHWKLVREYELLDPPALRREFLNLLDAWPRQPVADGRSFDQMFRHVDGYSVWWLGPGSSRQPTKGPLYRFLRALWVSARAMETFPAQRVVLFTHERRLAAMLASQCSERKLAHEFAAGSKQPAQPVWRGRWRWLLGSVARLALLPIWTVIRWLFARATAGCPRELPDATAQPAVVMSGWYPQHVRTGDSGPEVWYWRQLAGAIERAGPSVRVRFLLHTSRFRFSGWRKPLGLIYSGWRRLRRVPGVAPIQQSQLALGALAKALPRQLSALVRYARLERQADYRSSFRFAGADVSWLFVPALRRAVADIARWARNVEAVAGSLRAVGNVRAVLVHEEFYPKGMLTIAAARRLGIPTVGVQHGTIAPEHLVYCPPPGYVVGAPTPDYFAAYGQFAKEVVSREGAYPAERVWVVGGPRFDHLPGKLPPRGAARRKLGLAETPLIVLMATQQWEWSRQPCQALFEAVRDCGDVLVCVKTHPNEKSPERYRELARQCGAANVQFFRDGFDDLLAACDVLVSRSSTTLLEAILAGQPTICVNFADEPDRYPYVADGGSLGADSAASIRAAIELIRNADEAALLVHSRHKFLQRHLGPTCRGEAAATLAGLVAEQFLGQRTRTAHSA